MDERQDIERFMQPCPMVEITVAGAGWREDWGNARYRGSFVANLLRLQLVIMAARKRV